MPQRRQNVDIELANVENPPERLVGYPTLADFIARDKDAAIYRKFEGLSARSLLYQQSELHELEKRLADSDRDDAKNIDDEEAQEAAVKWESFSTQSCEQAQNRRELQTRIKLKLREYHEALMLESQILSLSIPAARTLRYFHQAFKPKDVPTLWGRDEELFSNERDLVALAPVDTDRLNIYLKKYFGYFFKEKADGIPQQEDLYYFPERRVQFAGLIITTLLSAIILIGAIVCLLLISNRSLGLRVGMIVLFTGLFAAVVGLLTDARRAEIFVSTAAYAAVLVVFISNTDSARGKRAG